MSYRADTLSSYLVTCLSGGTNGVVHAVRPSVSRTSEFLILEVKGLTHGQRYKFQLLADRRYDVVGDPLDALETTWTMHRTKIDTVLNSLPACYNTSTGAVLRALLEAIVVNDEKIGGDL